METIMHSVWWAREFAIRAHGDQKYGNRPYSFHIDDVVAVLLSFAGATADKHVLKAAYLHDVLEDTSVSIDELTDEFGAEVADLVWRVTDEPGRNRKERKVKTYPKIKGNRGATLIKMADRIANVHQGGSLVSMYQKEHDEFVAGILTNAPDPVILRMRNHLDALLR